MAKRLREAWERVQRAGWRLLKWIGFGVLFALIPFGMSAWDQSHHGHQRIYLYQLWSHGELAIVAVAVAADGISEVIFGTKTRHVLSIIGAIGCAIILVGGSYIYAEAQSVVPTNIEDLKDYSVASLAAFGITLVAAGICKVLTED